MEHFVGMGVVNFRLPSLQPMMERNGLCLSVMPARYSFSVTKPLFAADSELKSSSGNRGRPTPTPLLSKGEQR